MGYDTNPRRQSFVFPILLIGAGIYFLLVNLGYISAFSWTTLVRFWPVLLIAVGLDILFGRRSLVGAVISGLLTLCIVGGLLWLLVAGPQQLKGLEWVERTAPMLKQETLQTELLRVKEAHLTVDWGSGNQRMRSLAEQSKDLLYGQAVYYTNMVYDAQCNVTRCDLKVEARFSPEYWFLTFNEPTNLDIALHPDVTYTIAIESGSGDLDLDFAELMLQDLKIDTGSGEMKLALPGGAYKADIEAGSGDLRVSLPEDTALRLHLRSGSGDFYAPQLSLVDGKEHGRGVWETKGFDEAKERIVLDIDQGSGDLEIDFR